MTREEAINRLMEYAQYSYGIWHNGEEDYKAFYMAIEALLEDISEDGTLKVKVKDGSKVNRVLVWGNNRFGGLYYPE